MGVALWAHVFFGVATASEQLSAELVWATRSLTCVWGRGCGRGGALRVILGRNVILERVSKMEGLCFGKGQLCPCGSVMVIFYFISTLERNLGF